MKFQYRHFWILSIGLVMIMAGVWIVSGLISPAEPKVFWRDINPNHAKIAKYIPQVNVPVNIKSAELWLEPWNKVNGWNNLQYRYVWINFSGVKGKKTVSKGIEEVFYPGNGTYANISVSNISWSSKKIDTYWVKTDRRYVKFKNHVFLDEDLMIKCTNHQDYIVCDSVLDGNGDGKCDTGESCCIITENNVNCNGHRSKFIKTKVKG